MDEEWLLELIICGAITIARAECYFPSDIRITSIGYCDSVGGKWVLTPVPLVFIKVMEEKDELS